MIRLKSDYWGNCLRVFEQLRSETKSISIRDLFETLYFAAILRGELQLFRAGPITGQIVRWWALSDPDLSRSRIQCDTNE
jgi:hypothetical protein